MDAILRNEMPEYIVFKSALFYCSLIIILPVVAFFSSKWIIFDGNITLHMCMFIFYMSCLYYKIKIILNYCLFTCVHNDREPVSLCDLL